MFTFAAGWKEGKEANSANGANRMNGVVSGDGEEGGAVLYGEGEVAMWEAEEKESKERAAELKLKLLDMNLDASDEDVLAALRQGQGNAPLMWLLESNLTTSLSGQGGGANEAKSRDALRYNTGDVASAPRLPPQAAAPLAQEITTLGESPFTVCCIPWIASLRASSALAILATAAVSAVFTSRPTAASVTTGEADAAEEAKWVSLETSLGWGLIGAWCAILLGGSIAAWCIRKRALRRRRATLEKAGMLRAVNAMLSLARDDVCVQESNDGRWVSHGSQGGQGSQGGAAYQRTWKRILRRAEGPGQLASHLLAFEDHILVERLSAAFLKRRNTWRRNVQTRIATTGPHGFPRLLGFIGYVSVFVTCV